jgi:hypothetical protein
LFARNILELMIGCVAKYAIGRPFIDGDAGNQLPPVFVVLNKPFSVAAYANDRESVSAVSAVMVPPVSPLLAGVHPDSPGANL